VIAREHLRQAGQAWRAWPTRRHVVSALAAVGTLLVVAVPTAMIPNPVFGRDIGVTAWAWPTLVVTALLSGLVFATYVSAPRSATAPDNPRSGRAGMVGAFLTYLAVGCPVCNKLALVALGYAGAIQWFAPVQPWLAGAGIALLAYALVRRLSGEVACPLPRQPQPTAV